MKLSSSFRDPSGFIFLENNVLLRQVNICYKEHYEQLMATGLYEKLAGQGLLIQHDEVDVGRAQDDRAFKVIKPCKVPFISYPYEWCFTQLKTAALNTLAIHKAAMEHGMTLKDASAFNIQFLNGKPIHIDTLSFEKFEEGRPWVAYRQFCQHFLAPLALMARKDIRLQQLCRIYIDGIPLDLACRLLPLNTKLSPSLLMHLHLHANSQKRYANKSIKLHKVKVSKMAQFGLIDSLSNTVQSLQWEPQDTEWADYYADTNYTEQGFDHKKKIIADFIDTIKPATVWDLGANNGTFSRVAAATGCAVISFDIDPSAVEKNYQQVIANNENNILPLLMDLINPSPGIGWANAERSSLMDRGSVDLLMSLALIHHLAIGNNVPFGAIAETFAHLCSHLIIEFVPKEDSQVQRLLRSREDIFSNYNENHFINSFSEYFSIVNRNTVKESKRVLFLFSNKQARHG